MDFLFGAALQHLYFNQKSGAQYRTTYAIEKAEAQLLIFGSSRANHHYHPDIFQEQLNQTYYNAGRDGNFILYHNAILKSILQRHTPQTVILDFVAYDFRKKEGTYDRLSSLLPYYKTHPELRPTIELKSPYEKIKLCSSIYPYNSLLFTIISANLKSGKKSKDDNKGYIPLTEKWTNPIQTDTASARYEIDSIKIQAYQAFIQNCINSNVKLYIVCSPYFINPTHPDYSVTIAEKIAAQYNIPFFNFSNHPAFTTNPNLFADPEHMNNDGAITFSKMLADTIRSNK